MTESEIARLRAENERLRAALEPIRVFSKATTEEQILVRLYDKLSRLARGSGEVPEDTVLDLIGYLILLRVHRRQP
jgi:hypothetical protein